MENRMVREILELIGILSELAESAKYNEVLQEVETLFTRILGACDVFQHVNEEVARNFICLAEDLYEIAKRRMKRHSKGVY